MTKSSSPGLLSPTIRFDKIKNLSDLKSLKDEGFTLVELIVVVMMIGILSSIAIPQFMTSADKAKQKEATGIVSALVKGATAFQTEYGDLPTDALELSEYARFQQCTAEADEIISRGGAACKVDPPRVGPVNGEDVTAFYTTTGNYYIEFQKTPDATSNSGQTVDLFQVRANPTGGAYIRTGSAVMGCYNPTEGTSEVYEYKSNDPGPKDEFRPC